MATKPLSTLDPAATAPAVHHPVVGDFIAHRAANLQVKLAEGITRFAGSMAFVYLHIVIFALWMLVVEKSPWPTLTLVVSLEAIFLSTFVMIGQNRQSSFQQQKADHDFVAQEQELQQNTEITRLIHDLTREIHASVCSAIADQGQSPAQPTTPPGPGANPASLSP